MGSRYNEYLLCLRGEFRDYSSGALDYDISCQELGKPADALFEASSDVIKQNRRGEEEGITADDLLEEFLVAEDLDPSMWRSRLRAAILYHAKVTLAFWGIDDPETEYYCSSCRRPVVQIEHDRDGTCASARRSRRTG